MTRLVGTLPYTFATSGKSARDEIIRLLAGMGCTSVGFMDDFEKHEVILQFEHRGKRVCLRASAKGWATLHLRKHPHVTRMRIGPAAYEAAALTQGHIAVNSILRDWVRGQIMAIECGMVSFQTAFMPYMLLPDGSTVAERVERQGLLAGNS